MLGCRTATVAFLGFRCLLQAQRDSGANLSHVPALVPGEFLATLPGLGRAVSPSLHPQFLKMRCQVL